MAKKMGKLYRKSYGGVRLTRDEKLAVDTINAGISLLRKGKAKYSEYTSKRRLQKAHVIKRIMNSNLPDAVKKAEIAKLSGITAQTKVKGLFFKLKRAPRELRQASEANF